MCLQIIAAMHAYPTRPRTAWVREWPAMVMLAVSQIFWARGVEEALTQGTVQVSARLLDNSWHASDIFAQGLINTPVPVRSVSQDWKQTCRFMCICRSS
jgi:hypothetical protein